MAGPKRNRTHDACVVAGLAEAGTGVTDLVTDPGYKLVAGIVDVGFYRSPRKFR